MKKSLVALAALAVVGAASAQVTLTGTVSMGYQKSMDSAAGIVLSDDSFIFTAKDDLGGGTTLTMSTGFDAGGRTQAGSSAFGSENTSLTVAGGFGSIKLMSYESDGPFAAVAALGNASLPVGVFDSNAVGLGKRYRNGVTYKAPAMNGFTPALTYVTLAGQYKSSDSNSSNSSNSKIVPAVTYAKGPLVVYFEDAFFNADYPGTTNGGALGSASQPTITATYDFGSAKVGAAWTKLSVGDAQFALGVSVPVGALTFGLATYTWQNSNAVAPGTVIGYNTATTATTSIGDSTWTEASVDYALSKRTSFKVSMAQTNDAGVRYAVASAANNNVGGLVQNCEYRVGLYHSF